MTESVLIKDYLQDLGVQVQEDLALNDSDKTFVVPVGEEWDVLAVHINLISTATVGNRQITMEALGAADELLVRSPAGAVQAASLTRDYNFGNGLTDQSAFVSNELTSPLPRLILGPGMKLRVYDLAAIDAAADDMTVRVLVGVKDVTL